MCELLDRSSSNGQRKKSPVEEQNRFKRSCSEFQSGVRLFMREIRSKI